MKVYCKDCAHLKVSHDTDYAGGGVIYDCIHPNNKLGRKPIGDTWYTHNDYIGEPEARPWEINGHNNCEWFSRKVVSRIVSRWSWYIKTIFGKGEGNEENA